jgi:hypothetical protein
MKMLSGVGRRQNREERRERRIVPRRVRREGERGREGEGKKEK